MELSVTCGVARFSSSLHSAIVPIGMIAEDGFLLLVATYLLSIDRRQQLKPDDVGEVLKSTKLKPGVGSILQALSAVTEPETVDPIEKIGIRYSYPDWMVRRLVTQYGDQEAQQLCESLNGQAPLTLRVNTLKTTAEECQDILRKEGVETQRTKLSPFGLLISKRINVFQLQAFRDGLFEVQDEGSQLLPYLIDPKPTARVLDACAGAGGKTLELSALMKNRGEIVAADVHGGRLEELRKRARRAGASNVRIQQVEDIADLEERFRGYFDVVLIDAPCSGLGTLRRNPGIKWVVTEETVHEVSQKQLHIIESSVSLVKSGGILAYATCTLFREENEDVIENFLRTHPHCSLESPPLNPSIFDASRFTDGKYVKFFPHRDGTDGFFIAVMKKQGS